MPRALAAIALALVLAACTQPGRYPVTGEACAEGDPVQALDAGDCAIAPTGTGTF